MKHEAGMAHPTAKDRADIAQARVDLASGYGVSQTVISQWLKTWGKPGQLPFKEWLAAQDG
jgi:hypothetical protein